jgi:hypothetical protein
MGRIFCAEGQSPWMVSHTACPVPLRLSDSVCRVFFGTRDADHHPRIGFIDIDMDDPARQPKLCAAPALDLGGPGHFDEHGVYPGSLVNTDRGLLLYYMGRINGESPRYYMAIGLAISNDGGTTFRRLHAAPILDRSDFDPWMVSTPLVVKEGPVWRMWYLSGTGWEPGTGKSCYDIKYAESSDGESWRRQGKVAIERAEGESNIASPAILKTNEGYEMWYCVHDAVGYRIGYATSSDGLAWQRRDRDSGIERSAEGWDSKDMAYPSVFTWNSSVYMLYSGNGFGRDGIGIAVSQASR